MTHDLRSLKELEKEIRTLWMERGRMDHDVVLEVAARAVQLETQLGALKSPMSKPDYDTTLARIAGNIAAGLVLHPSGYDTEQIAQLTVRLARAIVHETKRTAAPASSDGK